MHIEGNIIRLRAVEPGDIDLLYTWENDCTVWPVSGTTEPFSREQMARFVARQLDGGDLLHTGQLRLIIETLPGNGRTDDPGSERSGETNSWAGAKNRAASISKYAGAPEAETHDTTRTTAKRSDRKPRPVGAVDLFEYDPVHRRAGIGILIYARSDRGHGYASDAVETLCRYAHDTLHLHQLWCGVGADNEASLRMFRRLGFIDTGIKRDWNRLPDGFRDEVMLQKILE